MLDCSSFITFLVLQILKFDITGSEGSLACIHGRVHPWGAGGGELVVGRW